MPLLGPRLALLALAAALIAFALWPRPAAAPPYGPHPKVSSYDPYELAKKGGRPVAVITRPVTLRATPGGRRVAGVRPKTAWGSPRVLAVTGKRGRWLHVIATELPNGRRGWIPLDATQLLANPWSIRADLSARRVTVREHGRVVRRFPVAVGSPSTPTPVGSFAATDKLLLTEARAAYGCCALALSGHQPHIQQGWKGGDRLAIHGTGSPGSIGTAASHGCLRAGERDIRWIVGHIWLGTIVEVRP